MKCIHCKSDSVIIVFIDALPCKHCGGNINVEYNVCKDCGLAWKTVDGELLENTTFFDVDIDELFFGDDLCNELDITIKNDNKKSDVMRDYIHKCLRCQSVCFETSENKWECPNCGFSWEVIKTDE